MQRNRAFTVIELILALAVMASAAILIIPAFFGRSQGEMRLLDATTQITDALRTMRQRALDKASPACVTIVDSSSNYRCHMLRDATVSYVASLPPGYTLHTLTKSGDSKSELTITFREDGSASGGQWEVHSPHDVRRIVVERLTGQITVELPEVAQ